MNHCLMRALLSFLFTVGLASCNQTSSLPLSNTPIDEEVAFSEPLGEIELIIAESAPETKQQLSVNVQNFTSTKRNPSETKKFGAWIFEEITQKETRFLPHLLSSALEASNNWGAVRVLPDRDPTFDITVSGEIIRSDGVRLELFVKAMDSTNRIWFENYYTDLATISDYPNSTRFTFGNRFDGANYEDPFTDLYSQIANYILLSRDLLTQAERNEINQVTQLNYAVDMAPAAFEGSLITNPDGRLVPTRFPADNDPIFARVKDMQDRHELFVDTVDEYYETLYTDIQPAYVLWRKYSLDEIVEGKRKNAEGSRSSASYGNSRNFLALSQRYDRFKWSKIYEHEFTELAQGFNQELAPAMLELNTQVYGLTGTMEQQYRAWRGTLRELFELELESNR